MGQQQLLLILLGTIIVIAAIGLSLAEWVEAPAEANRNQLVSDLTILSNNAQVFYKKPKEIGGGNHRYEGWELPVYFENYEYGTITVKMNKGGNQIKIKAVGTEIGRNGKKFVEVEADVKPNKVQIKIKN